MQMPDFTFPATDGRRLVMPRYTQPTPDQKLLHQVQRSLPDQPPPKNPAPAGNLPCRQAAIVGQTFTIGLLKTKDFSDA